MFNSNDESQTESNTSKNNNVNTSDITRISNQNNVNDESKQRHRSLSFDRRRGSNTNNSFSPSRPSQDEYRRNKDRNVLRRESETRRFRESEPRMRRSRSRSNRERVVSSPHRSRSPLAYGQRQIYNQRRHLHNHHHSSSYQSSQANYKPQTYSKPIQKRINYDDSLSSGSSSLRRRSRSPYERSSTSKRTTFNHSFAHDVPSRPRTFSSDRKHSREHERDDRDRRDSHTDFARRKSPSENVSAPPNNILAIFGLDKQANEQDLREMYENYGCINCKIIIDKHVIEKKNTDFAFRIQFVIF